MNARTSPGLTEFAERLRRVAYANPIYRGFEAEKPGHRQDALARAIDKRTRERCSNFYLADPVSIRASFLRLPAGDLLSIEFVDSNTMTACDPVPAFARCIVEVVFAGEEPEAVEQNPPWGYWLQIGREPVVRPCRDCSECGGAPHHPLFDEADGIPCKHCDAVADYCVTCNPDDTADQIDPTCVTCAGRGIVWRDAIPLEPLHGEKNP